MAKNRIDPVRASRDGHEFHEAWAARKALQLVLPTDGFVGLAIEGLAPGDRRAASAEAVEIADVVLYFGQHPSFEGARSVSVVQLKYSISSQTVHFRALDAKKTIQKFAAAFRSYRKAYGTKAVARKLDFELVTNRPIHPALRAGMAGLVTGRFHSDNARAQADQIRAACGLNGKELKEFAGRVRVPDVKRDS